MLVEILTISIVALVGVISICAFVIAKQERQHEQERKEWLQERKDLLDRIQAPSFAEYANKVVRENKAELPQEEVEEEPYIS